MSLKNWVGVDCSKIYLFVSSNTASAFIFFTGIGGVPFLFGSEAAPTVTFWCAWLGCGVILASTKHLKHHHLLFLFSTALLAVAWLLVVLEQSAGTPILTGPSPIWKQAALALNEKDLTSASVVRGAPYFSMGPIAANLLALVLGLIVGADRNRAKQSLIVGLVSGVGYSLYGIYALFFSPDFILWREKEFYIGELTGTFVFRNTAAVYLGSVAIVSLLVLLDAVQSRSRSRFDWRSLPKALLIERDRPTILRFLAFGICLTAVLATHSRAGIVLSLLGMLLSLWLFFARKLVASANRVLIGALCLIGSVGALQAFSGAVSDRINSEGLRDYQRVETYRATLKIIADYPWFGTGLGTFRWIFPAYRTDQSSMWGVWDTAHSTPLELAAEMGLPFAALVIAAWVAALFFLLRGALIRRRDRIIPQAALTISLVALTHSAIDFSLQISGYSIVVFSFLGVGLAQSFGSSRDIKETP